MKRDSRGFSLIELLIVVAIILIIAAIAIPNFMRSRMAANQASAVGSLRMLITAEATYASTYNTGYSSSLGALGGTGTATATAAGLIDSVLAGGPGGTSNLTSSKSGYDFTYSAGAPDSSGKINAYKINANPTTSGLTGINFYFTEQSGVIRQNSTAAATSTDSPIGG